MRVPIRIQQLPRFVQQTLQRARVLTRPLRRRPTFRLMANRPFQLPSARLDSSVSCDFVGRCWTDYSSAHKRRSNDSRRDSLIPDASANDVTSNSN